MESNTTIAHWGIAILLVSIRLATAIFATPLFSSFPVPAIARISLLVGLSVAICSSIPYLLQMPADAGSLLIAAFGELAIGLTLALGVRATFAALEFAGRLIEAQAGLGIASFFNPVLGQRDSIIGSAFMMAGLVFFMQMNGHHALLQAFVATFQIAPLASGWHADLGVVASYFAKTYLFGLMIGASAVLALWLVDVALATMVRSMPQFNILFLSFPLKLLLTLVLVALMVPHLGPGLITLFQMLNDYWATVLVTHG